MEIIEYSSRKAKYDVDCVAVCPEYPDYLVYGTYSLIKRDEDEEYAEQARYGRICVLTVSASFEARFAGDIHRPELCDYDFDAAVLDIRFHPRDGSLLGVALSDGTIHFFRFISRADVLYRRWVTELFPLGHVVIGEREPATGIVPVVTQFQWLPDLHDTGRRDVTNTFTVTVAATLDSGEVRMLGTNIPAIKSTLDHRLSLRPRLLPSSTSTIHAHSLEAWCVALVPVLFHSDKFVLLSGADDSSLLISTVTVRKLASSSSSSAPTTEKLDLFSDDTPPPMFCYRDRRSYGAGVTAILPLPPPPSPNKTASSGGATVPLAGPIPILTGSYDESARLFLLSPTRYRLDPEALSSLELQGGVWRLELMDYYTVVVAAAQPNETALLRYQHNYIVMASCMHAGAKILRVMITAYHDGNDNEGEGEWKWSTEIKKEAEFSKGHESMVYGCGFLKQWDVSGEDEGPAWEDIVGRDKPKKSLGLRRPHAGGLDGQADDDEPDQADDHDEGGHDGTAGAPQTAFFGGLDGQSMSVQEEEAARKKREKEKQQQQAANSVGRYTVVSTSFYDRSICVWTWQDTMRVRAVVGGAAVAGGISQEAAQRLL